MLIDNMWYGSDMRSNGKGDQDLITYVPHLYFWRRYSITDFPRLYYKRRKGRIQLTEMKCYDGKMPLMRQLKWAYEEHPHALIVGETGSGKTYALMSFIEAVAKSGAALVVIDAKNADLSGLAGYLPEVYSGSADIKEQVIKFYEDMLDRMESMKRCADYEPGRNYRALGFQARFMIFDEYVAYLSMLQKKEAEEVISYLQRLFCSDARRDFL